MQTMVPAISLDDCEPAGAWPMISGLFSDFDATVLNNAVLVLERREFFGGGLLDENTRYRYTP